jgi:hypothetical protein
LIESDYRNEPTTPFLKSLGYISLYSLGLIPYRSVIILDRYLLDVHYENNGPELVPTMYLYC